jgi:hypothetical protein
MTRPLGGGGKGLSNRDLLQGNRGAWPRIRRTGPQDRARTGARARGGARQEEWTRERRAGMVGHAISLSLP